MIQKGILFFLLTLLIQSISVAAEIQNDDYKFSVSYNDAEWETSTFISTTNKLSLVTIKRNANTRPYATFKVDVSLLDEQIPLEKYIRNNVKIRSVAWKVLEEKTLPQFEAENVFFLMEHKIGNRSNKVQRLIVKANGNVYDINCAAIEAAKSDFDSACQELITNTRLLP